MTDPSEVVLRFHAEEFSVRVVWPGTQPSRAALALGEQALAGLRFAVECGETEARGIAERLLLAAEGGGSARRAEPRTPRDEARFFDDVLRRLAEMLRCCRLEVGLRKVSALTDRRSLAGPKLPPLPPPRREPGTHSFELRLIDEVGQAIPGIDAEFVADELAVVPSNAAGVALLEGVQSSSATVAITDVEALSSVLDPRWAKARTGTLRREGSTQDVVFRGQALGPFALKAEVPNTVVVKPPLGKLFIELWDKSGRTRHKNRRYSIAGPASFSGRTDDQGRILHDPVLGGDYELTLFLEPEPDESKFEAQTLVIPLVTLAPALDSPQVRLVGAVPSAALVRLLGAFFDTNKSFLLADGVRSLAEIEDVFRDNNPSQLLVVGHTDTTADAKINDPLSLERAKSMLAFLLDDVDTWLKNYDSVPAGHVWGAREDQEMLGAVDDFPPELDATARIGRFQQSRNLTVDGIAGKQTRRQLIKEYMSLDAATLADAGFDIPQAVHGCGENFPLAESGNELDPAPADPKEDGLDRRVELYFFERSLGPQPPPPGKNSAKGSTQYPEWRKLAQSSLDIVLEPPRRIRLVDEVGGALAIEVYELVTADGQVIPGTSDELGFISIPKGIGNEVTLRLTSMVAEVRLDVL